MGGQSIVGAIRTGFSNIKNIFSKPKPTTTISPQATQSPTSIAGAGLTSATSTTGQTRIGGGSRGRTITEPTRTTTMPSPTEPSMGVRVVEGGAVSPVVSPTKTPERLFSFRDRKGFGRDRTVISAKGEFPEIGHAPLGSMDVKRFFSSILGTSKEVARFEKPIGSFFDPFKGRGTPKAEKELSPSDVAFFESQYGTGEFGTKISTGDPDFKGKTFGEMQEIKEIESGLKPGIPTEARFLELGKTIQKEESERIVGKFQPLIDTGALSLGEAETQAEKEFQEVSQLRFEKERGVLGKKISASQISGLSQTKGDVIATIGGTGLELGAFAAAFTTPVGGTIASAYLTGSSTKEFTTAVLGEDLSLGQRALSGGKGTLKAGLGLYGAGAIFATTPKSILARQSQREFLLELEQKPFVLGGREFARGSEGSLFGFTGAKIVGGGRATQKVDILAPIFRSEKGFPRIVGGKARSVVQIRDVISDVPLKFNEKFVLGSRITRTGERISLGVEKGGIKTTFDLKEFQSGFGTGFIGKKGQEPFREFFISGASKKEGDVVKVFGIRPSKIGFKKESTQVLFKGGRADPFVSTRAVERFSIGRIKGSLESVGQIKLLPQTKEGIGFISPAKITKTPFSKTFGQEQIQVQKLGLEPTLAPSIVKETLAESGKGVKSVLKTDTKPLAGSSGLTSQFVQQKSRQFDLLDSRSFSGTLQRPLLEQREKFGTGFRQEGVQILQPRQREALITLQEQKPALRSGLKQKAILDFSSVYFPKFRGGFGFPGGFKPFILPPLLLPIPGQVGRKKRKKGKRGFVRTPSLAGVTLPKLGFEVPKLSLKLEETGLVERPFTKKVKLPTTL